MYILAGQFKGRQLLSPEGKGTTRPITGHVKKSLFAMLGEMLTGQTVLDLYCGTGTMGLESISRGAKRCYFADRDPFALSQLSQNIKTLGVADKCVTWNGDIEAGLATWVSQVSDPIDVAFVDPPYATAREWDWNAAGEKIFAPLAPRLADDGVVVLRVGERTTVPETLGGLVTGRVRAYGDMLLIMLVRPESE